LLDRLQDVSADFAFGPAQRQLQAPLCDGPSVAAAWFIVALSDYDDVIPELVQEDPFVPFNV
jgi:hypothetical protein